MKKKGKKKRKVEKEENEYKKMYCSKTKSAKNQIEMSLGEIFSFLEENFVYE